MSCIGFCAPQCHPTCFSHLHILPGMGLENKDDVLSEIAEAPMGVFLTEERASYKSIDIV